MKYDILKNNRETVTLNISGGEITSSATKKITEASARIFKDGKVYSSAMKGHFSDEELIAAADKEGLVGIEYHYNLPERVSFSCENLIKESVQTGIEKFEKLLFHFKGLNENLNWSGIFNFEKKTQVLSGNKLGHLSNIGESVSGYLLYKRLGSTEFADGFYSFQSNHYEFTKQLDFYEKLISAVDKKAELKSKKMPVLILESYMINERLSDDLDPYKLHAGGTFLSGKEGKQIFSPKVSFKDFGYLPDAGLFTKFDAEGALHREVSPIQSGMFVGTIYDLKSANKFGKVSTGNGFRAYNRSVNAAFSHLSPVHGQRPFEEILKEIPECLVLVSAHGGGINEEWIYSTPVQIGILFKYGQAVGRVPNLSVKGNLLEILGNDFIEISSDGLTGEAYPALFAHLDILMHS